jgi:GT2 family glycosyltransferase
MNAKPKVYIIVLNYKNYSDTIECLESLLKLRYPNKEIIVVDNSSPNDSGKYLEEWVSKNEEQPIQFILNNINLGYAGGNNTGIRRALQDSNMRFVWILNNDTIVDENALDALVQKMGENPRIGVCGSKLIYNWDKNRIQGYGGIYNKWLGTVGTIKNENEIYKMDYVIGASMLIRREVLTSIGLLGEDYFLFFEELDYAQRIKGKFLMTCACDSVVFHKEGASIGAQAGNPQKNSYISDYYTIRNRILITEKYFPYCLPTVYLGLFIAIFNRIRRKQYDRIKMIINLMLHRNGKVSCKMNLNS